MGSSFCDYFNQGQCHSCGWIEQDYASQLARKKQRVEEALAAFAPLAFGPPVASAPQGFRNRAKMSVTGTLERPVLGLVGEERLDEGRELLACPIHHPKLNELWAAMPALIRAWGLAPYRISTRQGELKGLIAFYSPQSDQMYLRFVLRSREGLPRIRAGLPALQERFKSLRCVSANLQPIPHALLEGPEEVILSDQDFIEHRLGEVTLRLAPQAFVQTHAEVATRLYQTAADWIAEAAPARMLELYCGQGAFSFFAARAAPRTVIRGIEINADAVRAARATAAAQGWGRLEFRCADATNVDAEIAGFGPDLILVNPPRKGLGTAGVEQLLRHASAHLLYSSCGIQSLASDLGRLSAVYPRVRRIQLFDMFPHTEHFETLVWLERGP